MTKGFTVRLPDQVGGEIEKFCRETATKKTALIRSAVLHGLPEAKRKLGSINPIRRVLVR